VAHKNRFERFTYSKPLALPGISDLLYHRF